MLPIREAPVSSEGAVGREMMARWVTSLVMQAWKTKLVVQTHLKNRDVVMHL